MILPQWYELLLSAALVPFLAALLLSLRNGLASLGLYMDRSEGEATVESEYRLFWLFPRVRYRFWVPGAVVTGTAPASCARDGKVLVAWRPLHPHWHRPRDLMLDDVLMVATLWLSGLVRLLVYGAAAIASVIRPTGDSRR